MASKYSWPNDTEVPVGMFRDGKGRDGFTRLHGGQHGRFRRNLIEVHRRAPDRPKALCTHAAHSGQPANGLQL